MSPTTKSVYYNTQYGTLPTPTRANYTPNGWWTSATGGTEILEDTTVTNNANHSIFAHWIGKTYDVIFNANGGTCSTASKTVRYNETYGTLPTPVWPGHSFDGWYTAETGGTQRTESTVVSLTANEVLYAHWTVLNNAPNKPTITRSAGSTNYLTLKITGTDPDGNNLKYDVYKGGTKVGTTSTVASGASVTYKVEGLAEYTSYQFYVVAIDTHDASTQSDTVTLKTQCSGRGATGCNITSTTETCSTCGGDGMRTCNGRVDWVQEYDNYFTCPNCGKDRMLEYYAACNKCGKGEGPWYHNAGHCTACGHSTGYYAIGIATIRSEFRHS